MYIRTCISIFIYTYVCVYIYLLSHTHPSTLSQLRRKLLGVRHPIVHKAVLKPRELLRPPSPLPAWCLLLLLLLLRLLLRRPARRRAAAPAQAQCPLPTFIRPQSHADQQHRPSRDDGVACAWPRGAWPCANAACGQHVPSALCICDTHVHMHARSLTRTSAPETTNFDTVGEVPARGARDASDTRDAIAHHEARRLRLPPAAPTMLWPWKCANSVVSSVMPKHPRLNGKLSESVSQRGAKQAPPLRHTLEPRW